MTVNSYLTNLARMAIIRDQEKESIRTVHRDIAAPELPSRLYSDHTVGQPSFLAAWMPTPMSII